MRLSARRLAPLLSLALLTALGCSRNGPVGPAEPLSLAEPRPITREELEAARARWQELGIASYDVEYRETGAWARGDRLSVSVREGVVRSITSDRGLGPFMRPGEVFAELTVDGRFARLAEAFDQGAETVAATFDPRLGIPARVYLDYRADTADDEVGWTVEEFRRVSR